MSAFDESRSQSPALARATRARVVRALALVAAALGAGPASADASGAVPEGPERAGALSRPEAGPGACSSRAPVCVHLASSRASGRDALDVLASAERAFGALVGAMGAPAPLADFSLGGSSAFDVYVVDAPEGAPLTERDEPAPGGWDRASAFALVDASVARVPGCVRDATLARAVAEGSSWGLEAAEAPAARAARAAYLAEIVAPCAALVVPSLDEAASHPERALTLGGLRPGTTPGMIFPWFLDAWLGAGSPGALPLALLALGPQRTAPDAFHWHDEPDVFDTLSGVLAGRTPPARASDALLELAIARAFAGDRDDGMHALASSWAGAAARPRFEWSVPWSTLPRRLAPLAPIDPTGATYVWIDLEGAPASFALDARVEWEVPVVFRFAFVRVAKDGSERSRVVVPHQDRAIWAGQTVDDLGDLAGLLVVGTNAGDDGLPPRFDPDRTPYEPHGYVLTLVRER